MMRTCTHSLFAFAALLAGSSLAHASEDRIDQKLDADPHGVVEISNISGTVDVSGWDQPQVSINGEIPRGVEGVEVKNVRGHISITVRFPSFSFGSRGVDLSVRVPRTSEVDVTTVSADINSRGITGIQRLKAVSGSVRADIAQSDVEVKSVSGDVSLRGDGKPLGLHAGTISGSIHIDRASGDVEASTTSGEISMALDTGRSIRMHTISGDVSFRGKLVKDADVDAQTVSGELKLRADSESGFEYDVTTFNGDIGNCFNAKSEKTSQYGPGERLTGSLGAGTAHVRLKTMSGDIELCDKQ